MKPKSYLLKCICICILQNCVYASEEKELTAEQQVQVEMMMMAVRQQIDLKTASLVKIESEKVGSHFTTKVPFIIEKMKESSLKSYKEIAGFSYPDFRMADITNHCIGCFSNGSYPPAPYTFFYYPIGSKFKITEFLGTPDSRVMTILTDEKGIRFEVPEYKLDELVDGNTLSFQNAELSLLDILNESSKLIKMKIKIETFELEQFQKGPEVLGYWDFPALLIKEKQNFAKEDYDNWLRFAVRGITGKDPKVLKLNNIQKLDHDLVADVDIDPDSFVLLIHSKLINPYVKIENFSDYISGYRKRFEGQKDFFFGENTKSFIAKLKAKIPPRRQPTDEERKKVISDILEDLKKNKKISP